MYYIISNPLILMCSVIIFIQFKILFKFSFWYFLSMSYFEGYLVSNYLGIFPGIFLWLINFIGVRQHTLYVLNCF